MSWERNGVEEKGIKTNPKKLREDTTWGDTGVDNTIINLK
jgi:hypothetical protein